MMVSLPRCAGPQPLVQKFHQCSDGIITKTPTGQFSTAVPKPQTNPYFAIYVDKNVILDTEGYG
jgi:hypothetical protein